MKIGRYEVLDEIGHGAMGTVYRARDPLIERIVAIKTVQIAQLQQEGADTESRFMREAQSAGRLSHPNIVTIYDVGESGTLAYIAMEYLPGATLRKLMNKGPMPVDLVIDTVTQMAEALAFAHQHGVIHRDIKPANVVVTGQGGRIKLTDFGIAHLSNSDHTHAGQMLGSPRYMSPEQAMGHEIDGRSDIFSLGAVLYEMLTARYAFDGDSLPTILYRVINETPEPAASLRSGIPDGVSELLARMLQKDPAERPDARALLNDLRSLAQAAPLAPSSAPASRGSRLFPAPVFGALVVVLLAAGIGMVARDHFPAPPQPAAVDQAQPPAGRPVPEPAGTEAAPAEPPPVASTATESTTAESTASPAAGSPPSSSAPAETDAYLAGLDSKGVKLRLRRTELLLEYTARHPDVVQIDRQLELLQIERRRYLQQRERKQKS